MALVTDLVSDPGDDGRASLPRRIMALYALLGCANVLAWIWALGALRDQPALLGTAFLAWVLGLRHAVDPDHIAAIDNATRKLITQGRRPVTVGFWFACGHSTVVAVACALIGFFALGVKDQLEGFREVGGLIGTFVSSSFLLVIGAFNLLVFLGVLAAYREARRTGRYHEQDVDALMAKHGFLARVLRPLFALISKSWHMYPLGFLFGLGFDTATAIGLFSMTAATASDGVSLSTVMVFPALFAAGMALADATDGALMLGAYEWAYVKPARKLFYNLTVTAMSAFVALVIGMLQALGLIAERMNLSGGVWDLVGAVRDRFDVLGFVIVGLFMLAWGASALAWRFGGFDRALGREA
ncbi:MAG: high-affinity nickel-transporter [Hyphomicrobiales bacterium]|nr:high-affinity nickel-transporter [Hyphomicrobiales bacterium]